MTDIKEIKDLFGNSRFLQKGKYLMSERAGVLKYFIDRARDINNQPLRASFIGMKLSHLNITDLYAFKSMLQDRERTIPDFNWNKAFWGMLKTR